MDENEKIQEQIDIENITCNKTEYNYFEKNLSQGY